MRPFRLPLLFLLTWLTGCEGESLLPEASFDAVAACRPVNLARVLGSDITLLGRTDTVTLHLNFDPATGINTFTAASADTLLTARAFRFRRLYHLVETFSDSSYWVHAVRIRRVEVQGLNTGYSQMYALSAAVKQGQWPELVRFHNAQNDSFRLRFDRRMLRDFYTAQVDSFPVLRVQKSTVPRLKPATSAGVAAERFTPAPSPTIAIFPNPASTVATLTFDVEAPRTVRLYDLTGRCLYTWETVESRLQLPVRKLAAGSYLVRTCIKGANAAVVTTRLVVQR
jgi:hypothetical protein